MRFFILLLSGFSCLHLQAQKDTSVPSEDKINMICHYNIEKDAEVDLTVWKKYLENNLEPDSLAMDSIPAGSYKISVRMIIDREGRVSVAGIVDDPGFSLGQRLKKIIEDYPGRWKPAEQNGREVKNYRIHPVIFVVEEEKTCITEPSPGLTL